MSLSAHSPCVTRVWLLMRKREEPLPCMRMLMMSSVRWRQQKNMTQKSFCGEKARDEGVEEPDQTRTWTQRRRCTSAGRRGRAAGSACRWRSACGASGRGPSRQPRPGPGDSAGCWTCPRHWGDQTGPAQKDRQENVCSRSESDSDCQSQKITSETLRWMRRDEIIGSQISSDKFLKFPEGHFLSQRDQ